MDIEAIALFMYIAYIILCCTLHTHNGSLADVVNLCWSYWVHSFKETRKRNIFVVQDVSVYNF